MNEAEVIADSSDRRRRGQSGQVLLLLLIFLLPMTMATMSVYNVGTLVSEKMTLQNASDNAAYSAAIWDARYLNQMAYINRAMVANYDTIATLVGLWSMLDAFDGLLGLAELVGKIIFDVVDDIVKIVHTPVGYANKIIGTQIVGGSSSGKRVAYAIETYTKILSYMQQALYIVYQTSRQQVIEEIAWGVDKGAQYWLPVEAFNVYSLNARRKWAGTDKDKGLRKTVSLSLNDFSNGLSVRQGLLALMPQFIRDINSFLNSIPCPVPGGVFDIKIGLKGFAGYPFNRVAGTVSGVFGTEFLWEVGPLAGHEIVQDTMLTQVDFAGVEIAICIATIGLGHYSNDDWNTGGTKGGVKIGLFTPHIADANDGAAGHHYDNFSTNGMQCGPIGAIGGLGPELEAATNDLNAGMKECTQSAAQNQGQGKQYVAINNGTAQSCHTYSAAGGCKDSGGTPIRGSVRSCNQLQDIYEDIGSDYKMIPCQTAYVLDKPLHQVKVTTYVSDDSVKKSTGVFQGPSTLVYFRKGLADLGVFNGLGIGPYESDYNLQTYAFAKTYYTTRVPPNWLSMKLWEHKQGWRTTLVKNKSFQISGNETAFNPFWAGKLDLPSVAQISIKPKVLGQEVSAGGSFDPLLH